MKQVLILAAFALALAAPAHAQMLKPAQVPAAAKATFKAKFPTVKTNSWEKEGDKFEAGFKMNGNTMSAVITPAGELVETVTDISPAKLPAAVINLSEGDSQQQVLAYEVPSASGARYEGQNLSLFTKGDEASLERYGQPTLSCTEIPTKGN